MIPGGAPTKGRLLVATPTLLDPNFDRTVVLMLEHHADGAVGVVLNRPTEASLVEPLDRWIDLQSEPASLFVGGPVETDALIALARTTTPIEAPTDEFAPVTDDLASADLSVDPAIVGGMIDRLRVFRGYAGWGPGQLEGELAEGAWLVVDAETDDVFTSDPDDLWRAVLRRQPGRLAWLAGIPDDLTAN